MNKFIFTGFQESLPDSKPKWIGALVSFPGLVVVSVGCEDNQKELAEKLLFEMLPRKDDPKQGDWLRETKVQVTEGGLSFSPIVSNEVSREVELIKAIQVLGND